MRILFLFFIQFYSPALGADHTVIREETAFEDIAYEDESSPEIPIVYALEGEEEEDSTWYSEVITFTHSAYTYCSKSVIVVKFIKTIFRYILYLNIRI
jgi:hypothetical protein